MCHKTHGMATRYGSHETEDLPTTQDSPPLDLVPLEHPMLEEGKESSDEYGEETDTCCPLGELLEQFSQLKDRFAKLIIYYSPIHTCSRTVTSHRYCSTSPCHSCQCPSPVRNQCIIHAGIHRHLAYNSERIKPYHNHMLQDIPTFDGLDSQS